MPKVLQVSSAVVRALSGRLKVPGKASRLMTSDSDVAGIRTIGEQVELIYPTFVRDAAATLPMPNATALPSGDQLARTR